MTLEVVKTTLVNMNHITLHQILSVAAISC